MSEDATDRPEDVGDARRKAAEIEMAWSARETPTQPTARSLHAIRIEVRQTLSERQNHRCCWCGERMADDPGPRQTTLEHVVPSSRGGSDDEANLAASCRECNHDRGDAMDWLTRLPDWDDSLLGHAERDCSADYATARRTNERLQAECDEQAETETPEREALARHERAFRRRFGREIAGDGRSRWLREHGWTG